MHYEFDYEEAIKNDCHTCATSLAAELRDFQSQLTNEQEMMVIINGITFRLEKLRAEHNTFIYYGSRPDNSKVQVAQHYHQSNILFFAAPKRKADAPPVRIGFAI